MAGRRDPDGAGICARPHLLTRLAPSCVQQRFSGRARLEQHQGRSGGLGGDFFGQCQPRGPLAEHTPPPGFVRLRGASTAVELH